MFLLEDNLYRKKACLKTAMDIRSFVYELSESEHSMPIHLKTVQEGSLSKYSKMIRRDSMLLIGLCSTVGGPVTSDPLFPKNWRRIKDSYAHLCGIYSGYHGDSDPGYHRN